MEASLLIRMTQDQGYESSAGRKTRKTSEASLKPPDGLPDADGPNYRTEWHGTGFHWIDNDGDIAVRSSSIECTVC
jgi:hypothetical protein